VAQVSAKASAEVFQVTLPYGLMVMGEPEPSCGGNSTVNIPESGSVVVAGGSPTARVYVRSECGNALACTASGGLFSGGNDVRLGVLGGGNCQVSSHLGWIGDPFHSLPQPVGGSIVPPGNYNLPGSYTIQPGIYENPLTIDSGVVTMAAGTYIFRAGILMTGGTLTSGVYEVLIFCTCAPGFCDGSPAPLMSFTLTSNLLVKGRSDMHNIAIWIDRTALNQRF
jgi:hypothetical protein